MTNADKVQRLRDAAAVLDGSCAQRLWLLMETEAVLAAPTTPGDDPGADAIMAAVAAAKAGDPGGPCSGRGDVAAAIVEALA